MTDENAEDWAKHQSDEEPLPDDQQAPPPAQVAEDDGDIPPAYRKRQSHAAWMFAKMSGDKCRFNHSNRKWYLWHRHYWREDKDGGITRLWNATLKARYAEALKTHETQRVVLINDIHAAGATNAAVRAGLELASVEFPIFTSEEDWNNDPYLIACTNGVVDLRTGDLRDGRPEDMISLCTNVAFDPNAKCDRWDRFIGEVFPDDFDLQEWMREFWGAALVGTKKEVLLVNYGKRANNGKSKSNYALMKAVGDYAATLPVESLMNADRKAGGTTNDLMVLRGARMVFTNEPDRGSRLKGGVLKRMVSVDEMTGRPNYGPQVSWSPTHSIILSTNTLPTIDDADNGVWDRIAIVPWPVRFHEKGADDEDEGPEADRPEDLEAELASEAPGILTQLVRYAVAYVKKPTLNKKPEVILNATADYRQNEDTLAPFIAAHLVYDKGSNIQVGILRSTYKTWCEEQEIPPRERQGPRRLATAIEERGHGVTRFQNSTNLTCLDGIRLRLPEDGPTPTHDASNGMGAKAEPQPDWWEEPEEEPAAR